MSVDPRNLCINSALATMSLKFNTDYSRIFFGNMWNKYLLNFRIHEFLSKLDIKYMSCKLPSVTVNYLFGAYFDLIIYNIIAIMVKFLTKRPCTSAIGRIYFFGAQLFFQKLRVHQLQVNISSLVNLKFPVHYLYGAFS